MTLPATQHQVDSKSGSDAALLLCYQYKYGHISFKRLIKMAEQGIIPKQLKDTYIPPFLARHYAKSTKRPWRNKKRKSFKKPNLPTRPGHVVSADQLVSPTPGLIAHIIGILTKKRYKYATVFVDQYSRLSYLFIQNTATVQE